MFGAPEHQLFVSVTCAPHSTPPDQLAFFVQVFNITMDQRKVLVQKRKAHRQLSFLEINVHFFLKITACIFLKITD